MGLPEEHEDEEVSGGSMDPEADEVLRDPEAIEDSRDLGQILVVEVQEGDHGSDREDNIDTVS